MASLRNIPSRTSQFKHSVRITFRTIAALAISAGVIACGGGGGGDGGDSQARIQGTAFLPPGVDDSKFVAANAPVSVIDLNRPKDNRVVATSATDSQGRFDVTVPRSSLVAVVVQGKAQVSGLINADGGKLLALSKDFTGSTDLACRGAVQSIDGGLISASDVSNERIGNLELAALDLVNAGSVDFTSDASILAAVQLILDETDFGRTPPPVI